MFKLAQSVSYFWPVTVEIPVDGGKFEKSNFDAEFKRMSSTEVKEFRKSLLDGSFASDEIVAKTLLIGWKGISDSDGSELPFSETNKQKVLEIASTSKAVVTAFLESMAGAKTKN